MNLPPNVAKLPRSFKRYATICRTKLGAKGQVLFLVTLAAPCYQRRLLQQGYHGFLDSFWLENQMQRREYGTRGRERRLRLYQGSDCDLQASGCETDIQKLRL